MLARSPVLWKKVDVQIFPSHNRSLTSITKSFIDRLLPCVTYIRLDFNNNFEWVIKLVFVELCVRLQEKCPHLEVFILIRCEFSDSLSSVINLCTQFLQDVKKLVFCYCLFSDCHSTGECDGISKMEVLGVWLCEFEGKSLKKTPFSRMPYLKELYLSGSHGIDDSLFKGDTSFLNQIQVLNLKSPNIGSRTFSVIKNHGINIKELCLLSFDLQDHDLNFNNSIFPQLTTICLVDCYRVTCEGVVSLIQSCQSLQNVYVDNNVAKSFAAHPFAIANRCKSRIVKEIYCNRHCGVDCFYDL